MDRAKEALLEHAYLITLGAVVAVIAASAMYTSRVRTQYETQVQAAADAPEVAQSPEPQMSVFPVATPLPTIAPLTLGAFGTGAGRVWPVSGEIVRAYTPDEPVLWEALSCYQAHRGVDIAGEAGEVVLCIMDGVVEEISRDELWGWRVRIAQTDGSEAVYAGLGFCALQEGQAITRGQAVGELMKAVPCEAELGAHLHLELIREGQTADPQELLQHAARK